MYNESLTTSISKEEIIKKYGEWTGMSIYLGNDDYTTTPPKIDYRLRRLVQTAADILNKPFSEMRVLDLACLEGHYGLEFALQGAQVVGIEIREANIQKAIYVKELYQLNNFTLYQDDVRNLSKEKYGTFDLVICSGILYHLKTPDVFQFIKSIYEVCDKLVFLDTLISLSAQKSYEFEGHSYWGLDYIEHDENATEEQKKKDLWASIDNVTSFWISLPSLSNLFTNVGFSSFYECLLPYMPNKKIDRKTFIAIKGQPVKIVSSPITENAPYEQVPEKQPQEMSNAQIKRGAVFMFFKKLMPATLKDSIKPLLRAVGILPKDQTPEFLKKMKK